MDAMNSSDAKVEVFGYAAFWKRVLASVIDMLILMFPMLVLILVIAFGARVMGTQQLSAGHKLFFDFVVAGIFLGYTTYFIGSSGQTIGKRVMGLKVVMENGRPVGYPQALGRAASFWLYTLPFFIGGIVSIVSFVMLVRDIKRRSLHDRMCSTVVLDLNG